MSGQGVPKAKIKPIRWPVWLIWIVPILALVGGIVYYIDYRGEHAAEITIRFSDASGLKVGQTAVSHLGVDIGEVSGLELSPDHTAAMVRVDLNSSATDFARAGTVFWIERAEVSAGNISGLTTVISGPFIDGIPGDGPPATEFVGLDKHPITLGPGVKLILYADRIEHLQRDAAVQYRGIQVGVVQGVDLMPDSTGVNIHIFIWQRFAPLVRGTTQFWVEKGIDISGGILAGLKFNVESLKTILSGGIAFATEDLKSPQAVEGAAFPLNDEPKKEWLAWKPKISIASDSSQSEEKEESEQPSNAQQVHQTAAQALSH